MEKQIALLDTIAIMIVYHVPSSNYHTALLATFVRSVQQLIKAIRFINLESKSILLDVKLANAYASQDISALKLLRHNMESQHKNIKSMRKCIVMDLLTVPAARTTTTTHTLLRVQML